MSDETYNGWTNRETWAVALYINNDRGWQESVLEALGALVSDHPDPDHDAMLPYMAGEIIRDHTESLQANMIDDPYDNRDLRVALADIGSLWRVDWDALGAAFLADIAEDQS